MRLIQVETVEMSRVALTWHVNSPRTGVRRLARVIPTPAGPLLAVPIGATLKGVALGTGSPDALIP